MIKFKVATLKARMFCESNYTADFRNYHFQLLSMLSLLVFMSCQQGGQKEEDFFNSYSIDTVLIDAKGQLIDINGLMTAGLDGSDSIFYLFNRFEHAITEIDLAAKAFKSSYHLEREGPDGVGDFVFGLQSLSGNQYFVKSNFLSSVVDKQGKVIERIPWEDIKTLDGQPLELLPRYYEYFYKSGEPKCLALSLDFANQKAFLDVLDINGLEIKRFDVDPLKSYSDFFLRFDDQLNFLAPNVSFRVTDKYVCISHEFSNEIVLYTHEGEFVKVVQYEPQQTASRAKIPTGATHKPRDEVKKQYQYLLEQVRFEPPVYDKTSNRYFRLSAQVIFDEDYEHENSFVPKFKDTKVFVSVFDSDFKLIYEIEIPEVKNERMMYFAKDGKLWLSHNFSDDLGFLVIEL